MTVALKLVFASYLSDVHHVHFQVQMNCSAQHLRLRCNFHKTGTCQELFELVCMWAFSDLEYLVGFQIVRTGNLD